MPFLIGPRQVRDNDVLGGIVVEQRQTPVAGAGQIAKPEQFLETAKLLAFHTSHAVECEGTRNPLSRRRWINRHLRACYVPARASAERVSRATRTAQNQSLSGGPPAAPSRPAAASRRR